MKVFYVDPMGYGNLSSYDTSLLNNISQIDIEYFTSVKFDLKYYEEKTHKIYSYSDKKGLIKIFSYIKSQIVLLKFILKLKPEIAHFQWFKIPILDNILLKIIKSKGVKIILTAHNILPHDSGNKYFKIYQKIYSELNVIIVHANNTKQELVRMFDISPSKIKVIPHGILNMQRTDVKSIEKANSYFSKEYHFENKIVFSILGSINKYKGVDLAIEAWLSLNENEKKKAQLVIAGNGKMDVLNVIKNHKDITLINRFLSNDEFLSLVHLSDYILLPYIKISQSGVLLTALNEKKKVIVSNIGGLSEPFQFGDIGLVIKSVDHLSLLNTFKKAIQISDKNPDDEVWNKIHNFYSWKSIGKKTKELYQSL